MNQQEIEALYKRFRRLDKDRKVGQGATGTGRRARHSLRILRYAWSITWQAPQLTGLHFLGRVSEHPGAVHQPTGPAAVLHGGGRQLQGLCQAGVHLFDPGLSRAEAQAHV